MKFVVVALVLLGLVAFGFSACVAPPSDLNVCALGSGARIPQEYAFVDRDREIQAYFKFLENIKAIPTKECAEAYLEFACSEAYPRCNGDANSGLSYTVNTCYYQCSDFVRKCQGQLLGVERPFCGKYSVTEDCTGRQLRISNGASSMSISAFVVVVMAAVAIVL